VKEKAMKKCLMVVLAVALLAGSASAAALTYAERLSGTVTYLDITAAEGGNTLWTMTVNLGRADGHGYWGKGEIHSFVDAAYGTFDYSPDADDIASKGMYLGGTDETDGGFSDTGGRGASAYVFTKTITSGTVTGTYTTTINAPTNVTLAGGIYNYETTITTTLDLVNPLGNPTADIAGFDSNYQLSLNHGGYNTWTVLNPIVSGQSYPVVHAGDSSDGHQLYDVSDWYGTETGDSNFGFLVDMTVKGNAESDALDMRPGMNFELVNDDISLNYANRTNNNIGKTLTDNDAALKGYLYNAREAYNADPLDGTGGGDLAEGETWTGTSTLTITAPAIPEPGTMALLGLGVIGLVARRKRK
jgi:hypothetical protein